MGDLIGEILAQLMTIEGMRHTAIYLNQFEDLEDGADWAWDAPAAFVQIETPNLNDIGGQYQGSDIDITIHLAQIEYNSDNVNQNLSIFALRDLAIKAFARFKPSTGSIFVKTGEEQDFRHTNVYHYQLMYKTHWIDNTAVPQEYVTVPPIDLTINRT